ncbi:junctional sarcoplasmic reticulum protein 1 isoform 3-T3 [Callospermophilus lateralis]|uniref:junctional sarcoplasmic reticulum protein 1 isoform X3 n=1 Tax=Callospermophilus lateralis TaxID=76772 RepID=UPI004053F06F
MTTRASEELDRGLGSCLASEDLSALADPCPGRPPGDKPPETPRLGSSSTWPQDSREAVAVGNVATNPKKMEKEPVVRGSPGAGKEKLKSGATPRSVPARKKAQAAPPQPPVPLPALGEELPWGDVTLNKCLVLASLVALLGSAFHLCHARAHRLGAPIETARSPGGATSTPGEDRGQSRGPHDQPGRREGSRGNWGGHQRGCWGGRRAQGEAAEGEATEGENPKGEAAEGEAAGRQGGPGSPAPTLGGTRKGPSALGEGPQVP